jgi:succinate dehydrogenase / fumarate reductase membrane anchor subunit
MSRAAQGLRAWLLQRFTAIYLAVYLCVLLVYLALQKNIDYPAWHGVFAAPLAGVATGLFSAALLLHVWVGIRDVLIDYVHAVWLRLVLMTMTALALLGSVLWVVRALMLAAMRGAAAA